MSNNIFHILWSWQTINTNRNTNSIPSSLHYKYKKIDIVVSICGAFQVAWSIDFIKPQIAPLDPPTPKMGGLEPNMKWIRPLVAGLWREDAN